ncbi:hypothetical protein GW17_00056948 [Ensete ventricosum]|nr:hypothetical protein GW17_00056948 [Ensete ventricosum]
MTVRGASLQGASLLTSTLVFLVVSSTSGTRREASDGVSSASGTHRRDRLGEVTSASVEAFVCYNGVEKVSLLVGADATVVVHKEDGLMQKNTSVE